MALLTCYTSTRNFLVLHFAATPDTLWEDSFVDTGSQFVSPGWSQTHDPPCLRLPRPGTTGVHYHGRHKNIYLNDKETTRRVLCSAVHIS
jgi:hypothetical protein